MDKEEKIPYAVSAWIKGKQIGTMYIARNEGICYDEGEHKSQGQLHLFYDTPLIDKDPQTNTLKFDCASCIAEIPSYMYQKLQLLAILLHRPQTPHQVFFP